MSYLELLRSRQPAPRGTDKTDESPPSHEEMRQKGTAKTDESPLLSVLAPPPEDISKSADPWIELYRAWLLGIHEERVLLTLDPAQVQAAIDCGAVSREVAQKSVLLLVKVPKCEAGPGAVGLLAVPRDRWADFSPSAAIEALQAWH